jgi:hypothetical protein
MFSNCPLLQSRQNDMPVPGWILPGPHGVHCGALYVSETDPTAQGSHVRALSKVAVDTILSPGLQDGWVMQHFSPSAS